MGKYLVTGSSRGIGMATAKVLIDRGHTVYGTYNTNADVASRLEKEYDDLTMLQVDMADYTSIDELVKQLRGVVLDGIVNSAGM